MRQLNISGNLWLEEWITRLVRIVINVEDKGVQRLVIGSVYAPSVVERKLVLFIGLKAEVGCGEEIGITPRK